MRLFFLALSLLVSSPHFSPAQEPTPSALEKDPKGWSNLFPGKDLQGWKRALILPDKTLDARNPWQVDDKNKVLICDGVGIKEMLLVDRPVGDGIFHVEWRFKKTKEAFGYNGGIYVRTAADGTSWVQCQVAHQEKPPFVADLFGDVPVKGKTERVIVTGTGHKHMKPIGEWNVCEITCKGPLVQAWLNGHVVTTWPDCPLREGHIGLQAEFWYVEFRNLQFKDAK